MVPKRGTAIYLLLECAMMLTPPYTVKLGNMPDVVFLGILCSLTNKTLSAVVAVLFAPALLASPPTQDEFDFVKLHTLTMKPHSLSKLSEDELTTA
jgi:hypothetical protein